MNLQTVENARRWASEAAEVLISHATELQLNRLGRGEPSVEERDAYRAGQKCEKIVAELTAYLAIYDTEF
jgi:hypothetical protein